MAPELAADPESPPLCSELDSLETFESATLEELDRCLSDAGVEVPVTPDSESPAPAVASEAPTPLAADTQGDEPSLAEKLTTIESPRWRDRELTLRRFEFLLPRFVNLCKDMDMEVQAADALVVAHRLIKEAGIAEGLLEVFNNMYEVTSEVSAIASLAGASPPDCIEIWAMYATVRQQGMTSEDAKVGVVDVVRGIYFPGR